VLDTNVIVSAHLNADGLERYVLDLALNKHLECFVTEEILEEYALVLYRPKFKLVKHMVSASVQLIRKQARIVRPERTLSITVDPSDNRFLECAETADAHYLVSGNKRHFPSRWKNTQIVNARELLNLIVPSGSRD